MNRFVIMILIVLITQANLTYDISTAHVNTKKDSEIIDFKPLKDTIYAKNLIPLSRFIDTLILKRFSSEIKSFNIVDSIKSNGIID